MHKNNIAGNASTDKHPKFAQLTLDFTFKKAFAEEECKELLISLIEAFIGKYLPAKIKDVQLRPTERNNKSKKGRAAVFDVHCTDNNGNMFIIEMQLGEQAHFIGRLLFYISQTIMRVVKKGKEADFNLPRIYSIGFLNYEPDFEIGIESKDVVRHIGLSDIENPKRRYNHIHLALVIITRFNKTAERCKTIMDKWLYLFRNLHKLKKAPPGFDSKQFKLLFEIAKIANFTEDELSKYEESMKNWNDYNATIDFAVKKAVAKAVAKAVTKAKTEAEARGEARGKVMGETRGKAMGKLEGKQEDAKSMLAYGLDPTAVAFITKLPKKQIMAMR
jgi:predicted transposase/invertase (TIGR01784 family)